MAIRTLVSEIRQALPHPIQTGYLVAAFMEQYLPAARDALERNANPNTTLGAKYVGQRLLTRVLHPEVEVVTDDYVSFAREFSLLLRRHGALMDQIDLAYARAMFGQDLAERLYVQSAIRA